MTENDIKTATGMLSTTATWVNADSWKHYMRLALDRITEQEKLIVSLGEKLQICADTITRMTEEKKQQTPLTPQPESV